MSDFVQQLVDHPALGSLVRFRADLPERPAEFAEPREPLPPRLAAAFRSVGIERLYTHQARALDAARSGANVLLATPTASGKTLCFASAVFETLLADPRAKALFLYPTKALAQDQIGGLRDLAHGLGALDPPRFEIYDGDTPAGRRKKIKADPPQVLITNPDMLHLGLLGHHRDWEAFFRDLRWVVLDELHVYRGLFGAHVHHILARLRRIARRYGAAPRFVAASATVGNPGAFAETLVGEPFEVVDASGARQAPRELVFLNPVAVSPYTAAVRVLSLAIGCGLRTLAFAKARRVTELLHAWLLRQEPRLAGRIAPYRAGYLPAERRAIEARLFRGELLAVLSTSALELGIDVGALDLCVLVGYPGSLISSWQRIGRVGRSGRKGTVVLIALPDSLDQYVVSHPELLLDGRFERAVLDPKNPFVAGPHLVCAAAEEPLERRELAGWTPSAEPLVEDLARRGELVQDAAGDRWFSFRRRPHRDVQPRAAGRPYAIVDAGSGAPLGSIDAGRVWHECHPGAVYLHGGKTFVIEELDVERRRVRAGRARVDYYTAVLGDKETEILERLESRPLGALHVGYGKLKVTVRIREFQKKRIQDGEPMSVHPLDAPPLVYETVGFWIEMPAGLPQAFVRRERHFMGSIHAAEHATIGLLPLLAIADSGDVGGISYTGHPQLPGPAVFLYDGMPGGAGLSLAGFRDLETLLGRTREHVAACPCEDGCPSCIQSPRCGNGNKPLDKEGAVLVLDLWTGRVALDALEVEPAPDVSAAPLPPFVAPLPEAAERRHGIRRRGNVPTKPGFFDDAPPPAPEPVPEPAPAPASTRAPSRAPGAGGRDVVFDLETQRSAEEVGGWSHPERMGLALAVVYDCRERTYRTYLEGDVDRLLLDLVTADRVVGFNIDRFDLPVLRGYTDWDLGKIRTFDLLDTLYRRLGFRISLDKLAAENLGERKSADGLQAIRWWKEGRVDEIEAYCRRDVEVTWKLYRLGRERGYVLYRDAEDRLVRAPVDW